MLHNDKGMSLLVEAVPDAASRLGEDVMVLLGTVERVDPDVEGTVLAVCAIAVAAPNNRATSRFILLARAIVEKPLTARVVQRARLQREWRQVPLV